MGQDYCVRARMYPLTSGVPQIRVSSLLGSLICEVSRKPEGEKQSHSQAVYAQGPSLVFFYFNITI